jgi:acyl dehydratase
MRNDPDATGGRPGDLIPEFSRVTGFANWNRYAAVNDEFMPIHMDDEAGRAAGYPGAIGMGNLQLSYLHNMVRDWLRDRGRLVSLSCQFRAPNLRNQKVIARGRIVSRENGSPAEAYDLVTLEVWTEDEAGTTLARGTATATLRAGV